MIGFKKAPKPLFNIEKESDFILDFFPSIKNEDWKYNGEGHGLSILVYECDHPRYYRVLDAEKFPDLAV